MTTLNSEVQVSEDVLFREVGGEAIVLNQKTGKYYGLDDVGTRMWAVLTDRGRLQDAYNDLLQEYNVSPEQLEQDLVAFVDELAAHDLLQVDSA